MAKTRFMCNLTIEIVDPIINGHYEKENFCNINYPIRNIFYLNRGDGLLTPILENLGLRDCEAPIYGQYLLELPGWKTILNTIYISEFDNTQLLSSCNIIYRSLQNN